MARFTIDADGKGKDYYIDVGSGGQHTRTSWQASKDKYYIKIIDQTNTPEEERAAKLTWKTPLKKLKEDKLDPEGPDEYYHDLDSIYVRAKIHVTEPTFNPDLNDGAGGYEDQIMASSEWIEIGPISQQEQDITVMKKGVIIGKTTTKELGWVSYN